MAIELTDSLAVRNRPHQFADIVGNSANVKTISGFLSKGQLPRTWLMSGEPGSGKCIIGESLVLTPTGLIPIERLCTDIGAVEKDIEVLNIDKCVHTSHTYKEEHCNTIKISTRYGYTIEGTPEHPVLVLNELVLTWKKLKDISYYDLIVFNFKSLDLPELDDPEQKNLGVFYAKALLRKNFESTKKLSEELGKSLNITTLPDELLQPKSKDIWAGFYSEVIHTTGIFRLENEELAKQIQVLLLTMGTASYRHNNVIQIVYHTHSNLFSTYSSFINNMTHRHSMYKQRDRPFCDKNLEFFIRYLNKDENFNLQNYLFDQVHSIECNTDKTVYDLTIPETHAFIANGIVNHNTTTARLLAMTVNCENIATNIQKGKIEPCLKCTSCKLALQNRHPDIREMNAGGEEGNVQAIRELLSDLRISPRFGVKCFILDECLPLDSEILLADGSWMKLCDMENKEGIEVLSFNPEKQILEVDTVTNYGTMPDREVMEIQTSYGRIKCSTNHKWWTANKWDYVRASDLTVEDTLFGANNGTVYKVKIERITYLHEFETLCDITCAKNHNFFVRVGDNHTILSSNCHLMSATAKSNLLKPIEEPPSHVLWMLCTTDPDKLPKAALTRCIKLYFEYPTQIECAKRLRKVSKKEYPDIAEALKPYLKLIAANTNCQMRDSYSVLESLASIVRSDPDISDEDLDNHFRKVLSTMGELTTPAIRCITHLLLHKYSLPLNVINELDPSRLNEFLNVLSRHAHYATMYIAHRKENSLKEMDKRRFYGINFIRFDAAMKELYEKLESKSIPPEQILRRSVALTGGVLNAINKQRNGLLSPEQAVVCGINSYMENALNRD